MGHGSTLTEVRLWVANQIDAIEAQQSKIGFLRDILSIVRAAYPHGQVAHQRTALPLEELTDKAFLVGGHLEVVR